MTDSQTFADLITDRANWVLSSEKNNFNFEEILTGIYSDPSHFIFELLQNAEDVKANQISFNLYNNRLEIRHNGKQFNLADIKGITGIGNSTKTELNAIGKFGLGFKSVFKFTDCPEIHSGKYHFNITKFVLPAQLTAVPLKELETLIILPFKPGEDFQRNAYLQINQKLENLGQHALLFLNNLENINWETPDKKGFYKKILGDIPKFKNAKKATISTTSENIEYLTINREFTLESKLLKAELAFKLSPDGKKIVPEAPGSKLSVFFPTEKITNLNFLVHAPFKTTPNRENIPLNDVQNKLILKETALLASESLSIIKKIGLLKTTFLNILPLDPKFPLDANGLPEPIYKTFFEKIKETLLGKEPILPAQKGKFTTAGTAALARNNKLPSIFPSEDLKTLFEKEQWLHIAIKESGETRNLYKYLKEQLGIIELEPKDFAEKLSDKFLKKKTIQKLCNMYALFAESETLWREDKWQPGILRKVEFIRLTNGKHVAPYNATGKPLAYLPSKTASKFPTVHKEIIKHKKASAFLKNLGLTSPDALAEFYQNIEPYFKEEILFSNPKTCKEHFQKILAAYKAVQTDTKKKQKFLDDLRNLPFVPAFNFEINKRAYKKPEEIYLADPDLKTFFSGIEGIWFIDNTFLVNFDKKETDNLFSSIGIDDKLKRISVNSNLSYEEKRQLRLNSTSHIKNKSWDMAQDFTIEGLKEYLGKPDIEKSQILWKVLSRVQINYFKGTYSWRNGNSYDQNQKFDAFFLKQLRTEKWLFDTNKKLVSPAEIRFSQLSDNYQSSENGSPLKKLLHFKPDATEEIEKDGFRVVPLEKLAAFEIWENEQEQKRLRSKEFPETTVLNYALENQTPKLATYIPQKPQTPAPENQALIAFSNNSVTVPSNQAPGISTLNTEIDSFGIKEIGRRAEKIVLKYLQQTFSDLVISDLNENRIGKGLDIKLTQKDGSLVKYIEVKGTVASDAINFSISGLQWETARKFPEAYSIFCVFDLNSPEPKIIEIENPVEKWNSGDLQVNSIEIFIKLP